MQIGDHFERRVRWTKDDLVAFARETGDFNPMHHDDAFAASTRFGGLIAAGGQPVAFLLGLCGSIATPASPGVGLEFTFKFVGPVYPDEPVLFTWDIVDMQPSERANGTIVTLHGAVRGKDDRAIVEATGKTLMVAAL